MQPNHTPLAHDEWIHAEYDGARHILRVAFTGETPSEVYRQRHEDLLGWFEQYTGKLLMDSRAWGMIQAEDVDWMLEDWFPRALAAGHSRVALVQSESAFNDASVDIITDAFLGEGFQKRKFRTVEDAEAWLAQQEPVA